MKRENGMVIGTCELFINGLRLYGERLTSYNHNSLCDYIKTEILGYHEKQEFYTYADILEFFKNTEELHFSIIDKEDGSILHDGKCVVSKIKVEYPDKDATRIKIRFAVL